jgi:hypothetical protein
MPRQFLPRYQFYDVRGVSTMPNESVFLLKQAGIPDLFAHLGGKSRYHTMMDNPGHLDLRSLQHQGSYALGLTRFGNLDMTNLRR